MFPKCYRANSRHVLRSIFKRAGFLQDAVFTADSEPAYTGNSYVGGLIGMALHRLSLLGILPRMGLYGFAIKGGDT